MLFLINKSAFVGEKILRLILNFGVFENCPSLGHYAANSGSSVPTFRDKLSISFPETSVSNCHYLLRNSPEERSSHLIRGGHLKLCCGICV